MKCPKCEYLGFEAADRCRNCGYDFSLSEDSAVPDLDLRIADTAAPAADAWLNERGGQITASGERSLPLFMPAGDGDDEPLIKLPVAPRTPLSVRRTPETPRLRQMAKAVRRTPDPLFEFTDETPETLSPVDADPSPRLPAAAAPATPTTSGAIARLAAAAIDHGILLAIDLTVIYFTLKIAALTLSDWRQVPVVPLLAFLSLLKFAYFAAFTAVGGQTIGKMGVGIRVIAEDGSLIDVSRALRRSLAGAVSVATFGAAFAPALFGDDGRALHDHIARTRVVSV
jgi:uncharacterized RDD family membrane protein YckC